jgi:acyl-CoA synthetase (NDP forming)
MVYLLMGLEKPARETDVLQFGEAGKSWSEYKEVQFALK